MILNYELIKVESSLPVTLDGMVPRRLALPNKHLEMKQTEELPQEKEVEVTITHNDETIKDDDNSLDDKASSPSLAEKEENVSTKQ